ncbi:hypothetical protein [Actinomadura formosensis]|uniref:hypothetical protein n=1 Tax=Actinomadura formosensis TaxID=60706 RepID=UPI001040E1DD|nr:hypothetical protein [Actinomadura formosensis]
MRHVAEAQARVLRGALPGPARQFPDYMPDMFSNITVEYIADLPAAGLSFWNGHRWHIHVRKDDPDDERAFTLLHQIKRIIDHPLQRQTTRFTEADWHALADHFAHQVLNPISTQERKEASYERHS